MDKKSIGYYTAAAIVVSNMIGAGVFTSLGWQLFGTNGNDGLKSGLGIILLWLLGGVSALFGALCYGELGAALPRSGGEYNYLSKIYHPSLGFLSGWVSATVGFAAPVAASAMAFGKYFTQIWTIDPTFLACGVVAFVTIIHLLHISIGSKFQNAFTILNIFIIIAIVVNGLLGSRTGTATFEFSDVVMKDIFSSTFAVSFFYVSFAYSGWNAAAYIADEIKDVQINLPRALFRATLFVTILYVLLNFVFLYTAPIDEIKGKEEVGFISATYIFGDMGGKIMSIVISLLLLSSISSMILAGPRVSSVIGEDYKLFRFFSKKNKHNVPATAIIIQSIITLVFVLTSTFKQVIIYIGFTLNMFTFLVVLGLIVMRIQKPELQRPYKAIGYPVTPVLFLCISGWLMYYGFTDKPHESLAGLGTVASGLIFYFIAKRYQAVSQKQ